ncbi:hypothetical protein [Streptomyces similanensis]|uniref:Lipoprotein n=1 Tax=Streptomyces similanensis TaxID=1274988 RepID=A0ABP9K3G4_9ACTN|nr:hypothetical protein HUT11_21825 [Streptomyces seoulensis]
MPLARRRPRWRPLGAAALLLMLTGAGCSNAVGHGDDSSRARSPRPTATVLGVDEARKKAKTVSGQVLDLIDIQAGEVTEPGPSIAPCGQDPDHLYRTVHPWSVRGVSEDELKAGFQRLRAGLPGKGWKIVQYGPNKSPSKTLELTADSRSEPYSVNAELWVSNPATGAEEDPKILLNIVSGCRRAPAGTDLSTSY